MVEEKIEKQENQEAGEKTVTLKKRTLLVIGSFVLLVLLVASIFTGGFGITGKAISKNTAGNNLVEYLNTVVDSEIKLVEIEEESGLYLVTVEYNGEEIPVYMTKDGLYYTTTLIPLEASLSNSNQQTENIPKSDKPIVELYVFTYCPYGLQMEKAIIPVVKLLEGKIDFKIRQIGAMHGESEKIEAERQLCIEKNYPSKFLEYINEFALSTDIGSCKGDANCLVPKLSALYAKLGIDASKINSCISSEGETLYNAEVSNAGSKGISGSPNLVINGVETSSSRDPESVKILICSAFNDSPDECSQTLSTSQALAGFGSGTSSGSSTASC